MSFAMIQNRIVHGYQSYLCSMECIFLYRLHHFASPVLEVIDFAPERGPPRRSLFVFAVGLARLIGLASGQRSHRIGCSGHFRIPRRL